MSPSPTSRSPDLERLRAEGYSLSFLPGLLVVSDVPVVAPDRRVARGRLVVPLSMVGDATTAPTAHAVWWSGPEPCDAFGGPLHDVTHPPRRSTVGPGVTVDRTMCVKPLGREFHDHHELVVTYVALLGAPVAALDPTATARTGAMASGDQDRSPFAYVDTASARAGIGALSARLAGGSVAIVGLGGTGSYVLDLVAKTPVDRIHLFDDDVLEQHNAFRAPGAASLDDLRARRAKVDHFAAIYSRMHRGVVPHRVRLGRDDAHLLDGVGFAFVCVDDGPSRRAVVEALERRDVAFVDVGMGLEATEGGIAGLLRVTTSTPEMRGHVREHDRIPFLSEGAPDPYGSNLQVADLNALNAALAVIRWKKLVGFYRDEADRRHSVYVLSANAMLSADEPNNAEPTGPLCSGIEPESRRLARREAQAGRTRPQPKAKRV